jgi:hypothetical protein
MAKPKGRSTKSSGRKATPRRAPAKKPATTRAPAARSAIVEFAGPIEVIVEKKAVRLVPWASRAAAVAAKFPRDWIERFFGRDKEPKFPDCHTMGEWDPKQRNFWVTCRNKGCTSSEGCHLFSESRSTPGEPRDEGTGGRWAEAGRVYWCSCVYSD